MWIKLSIAQMSHDARMTRWWRSPHFVLFLFALVAVISAELRIVLSAIYLTRHTLPATLRAASLTPADEAVYLQLAGLDPENRRLYLRIAAQCNPRDPKPLLDLGLNAEMNSQLQQAEEDFKRAAQIDTGLQPSWMLANFYFQQRKLKEFRRWGDRYRQMAAGDSVGLFRMEWNRTHNVPQILEAFHPLTCEELTGLAGFLDSQAATDVLPVDLELTRCSGKAAERTIMTDVSRLLAADRADAARGLWNKLATRKAFPYGPLDPKSGSILTNADFSSDLDDLGFNWRVNRTPGVGVRRISRAVELSFDGSEPDASTLLFEPVVLAGGATYRLTYRLEAEHADTAGFGWRLVELNSGKTLDVPAVQDPDRPGNLNSWVFRAPETPKTVVLALTYVRAAGHLRQQGRLILSDLKLHWMEETGAGKDAALLANSTPAEDLIQ
jgi:hypothetical protein